MSRRDRVAETLTWLRAVLDDLGIPWQVAGGLAALAHGADRDLHDVDVYVPEGSLDRILPRARDHHSHGPRTHRDEQWDCYFMEVEYAGEEIELAEAGRCRYREGAGDRWRTADVDFGAPAIREVAGVRVPVTPREQLVAYKRVLDREVDRRDVAQIEGDDDVEDVDDGADAR